MTEAEIREATRQAAREGYRQGVNDAKAQCAADLRQLADDFASQVFGLRQEIRHALGLPKLVSPDEDATLQ